MYKSNYHCHSLYCDGKASLQDFAEEALRRGFHTLGFSSHAPVPFYTDWNMPKEKMTEYLQEIQHLKVLYQGKLHLYAGLEIDYIDSKNNASSPYFQNLHLDYSIGSIHFISNTEGGELMPIDGNFAEFKQGVDSLFGGSLEKTIEGYFQTSMQMIEKGGFNIIGHIDKIQQNGHLYPEYKSCAKRIDDRMNELLTLVAEKGLIVEINTKSFAKIGVLYPNPKYLKRIKELHIPVQVNSDSHAPSLLENQFEQVYELLLREGITHTCELVDGKWEEIALKN